MTPTKTEQPQEEFDLDRRLDTTHESPALAVQQAEALVSQSKLEELNHWFTARANEIAILTPSGTVYYPLPREVSKAIVARIKELKTSQRRALSND